MDISNLHCTIESYYLDLAMKTEDGYFIVKDFKDKVVTLDDLKQLARIVRTKFKDRYQRPFLLMLESSLRSLTYCKK
jgi:hypothetical protein